MLNMNFRSDETARIAAPSAGLVNAADSDVRVAANFTVEPIKSTLEFWLRMLSIAAPITFAPYNQVLQQLLDPDSALNRGSCLCRVVLVRIADWLRDAPRAGDAERARLLHDVTAQFVDAVFAAAGGAPLIVGLCPNQARVGPDDARCHRQIHAQLAAVPGVVCVDLAETAARYGVAEVVNPHAQHEGHIPYTSAFFVAIGTHVARTIAALRRRAPKAIAVDCDNTLWLGNCGEDGADGVVVTPSHRRVQARLQSLAQGGVLLCLCSKNSEASVVDVFRHTPGMVLRLEDVVAHRINWLPKSRNLAELARELDIGLDTFLFLDDSASERAEIRAECPEVLVAEPPDDIDEWPAFLDHFWVLDRISYTEADRTRTEQYRVQAMRRRVQATFPSLDEFLAHLALSVDTHPLDSDEVARVSQLTARTSQFTISATACGEAELCQWLGDPRRVVESVHARDRYGDYGLIGAIVLRLDPGGAAADLEHFVLSCRALGKRVEHRMWDRARALAAQHGRSAVRVRIRRTSRNAPAREFFERLAAAAAADTSQAWCDLPIDLAARDGPTRAVAPGATAGYESGRADTDVSVAIGREPAGLMNLIAQRFRSAAAVSTAMRAAHAAGDRPRPASESPLQQAVAWLWEDLLGVRCIRPDQRFFDLGGDSLRLAEFVARVHELYRVGISLSALQNPSVAQVAEHIDALRRHRETRTRAEPALAAEVALDPAIARTGLAAPVVPARRVLLTGANGFLGSFLLAELLRRSDAIVTCIIRAPSVAAASRRLADSLRRYGLAIPPTPRLEVIAGDLEQPDFGLPAAEGQRLAEEIESVVHCAARVNFVYDYRSLKRMNVDSAVDMLRFATTGRLKTVHFMSTLGMLMSTERASGCRVYEDAPPAFERGLPNGYEQSKWVIDAIMQAAIGRNLPVTIYRPGMLVGEARTGAFAKTNEFAACMIKGCIQMGAAPAVDTAVELVPIDYVSRMIVEIAARPDSIGRVFHLGHPEPIHLFDLLAVLRDAGYAVEAIPFSDWKRRFFDLGPGLRQNALYPFADFIQQLDELHLRMPDVDDANTRRVAGAAGVAAEPMALVVRRILGYFQATGFLAPVSR